MESNYEKQVFIARDLFLNYDQTEMIRKFQLKYDENYLYLDLLDSGYRVSRSSGGIECCAGQNSQSVVAASKQANKDVRTCDADGQNSERYIPCVDYQVVMTIYDVLCYSKGLPTLTHEWCPLYALQVTMSSPDTDTFTQKYAKLFSGNVDKLLQACQRIGGVHPAVTAGADVCWQFAIFPFFPVQLRFWDGDEEFEPMIRLLWDRNALDFMHFETTYYAMGHLMERLKKYVEEAE